MPVARGQHVKTRTERLLGQLPHALSLARVLLVAGAHVAVLRDDLPLFATLVLLATLTDILDGPLARAYGTASRFGANVDTVADMLFYLSLPVWTWIVRPDVVLRHLSLVAVFTALYVFANFASHRTFGALGVHNRLSRTSATSGVVFGLYTILWGFSLWLYVALIIVLSADLAQRYGALLRAKGLRGRRATGNP
jgi:phosphatidylglycerophosphate synthase